MLTDRIPDQLLLDSIFSLLPTQSLCRCACVCKKWHDILRNFPSLDLNHHAAGTVRLELLLGFITQHGKGLVTFVEGAFEGDNEQVKVLQTVQENAKRLENLVVNSAVMERKSPILRKLERKLKRLEVRHDVCENGAGEEVKHVIEVLRKHDELVALKLDGMAMNDAQLNTMGKVMVCLRQ